MHNSKDLSSQVTGWGAIEQMTQACRGFSENFVTDKKGGNKFPKERAKRLMDFLMGLVGLHKAAYETLRRNFGSAWKVL